MRKRRRPHRAWAADMKVECFVCGGEEFTLRQVLLNTSGATFLGLDWANRAGNGLVCCTCGYVMTFAGAITVEEVDRG